MGNVLELYLLILSRSLDRPMRDFGEISCQCYRQGHFPRILIRPYGIMNAVWYAEILERGSGALGKALKRIR